MNGKYGFVMKCAENKLKQISLMQGSLILFCTHQKCSSAMQINIFGQVWAVLCIPAGGVI